MFVKTEKILKYFYFICYSYKIYALIVIYFLFGISLVSVLVSCGDVQNDMVQPEGQTLETDLNKQVELQVEGSLIEDYSKKLTPTDQQKLSVLPSLQESNKKKLYTQKKISSPQPLKLANSTAVTKPTPIKNEKLSDKQEELSGLRYGGTLNLASNSTIVHQDVHMDFSPALTLWGSGIVYSRLLRFHTDNQNPNTMSLECDLCESWVMEDFSTFVFKLRNDAKWQNIFPLVDQSVTASDVEFSLNRILHLNENNPPTLWSLSDIEVIDQSNIRLTARFPDSDFLLHLADGRSKIVSSKLFTDVDHLKEGPTIGSGPWIYDSSETDSFRKFSRNPNYFESHIPYLDSLVISVIPDASARIATFAATDQLDIVQVEISEFDDLLGFLPDLSYIVSHEFGTGIEIALNTNSEIFQDIKIRQALFYALDPNEANKKISSLEAISSVGIPLLSDEWMLHNEILKSFINSPQKSNQILKDLQFSDPIEFKISVGDFGDSYIEYSKILESQLLDAGFLVEVKILNRREFAEDAWLGGNYEMLVGPPAPLSFPNVYLTRVLHSKGLWNGTNIINLKIDELIETQIGLMDPDIRRDRIQEIQRLSMEEAHRFLPFTRMNIWAWKNHVRGFYPVSNGYEYFYWAKTWID